MRLFARPIEHWPKAVFKDKIYRPWLPGLPIFLMDPAAIREEIAAFTAQLGRMRLSYLVAPDAFHEARATPLSDHARRLRATVDRMISRRRRSSPRGDLVDLLMNAEDPETGRVMDDATLRDNLLGFIVAGHETSAVTLAWALYLVTQDASTAGRLCGEIEEVTAGAPIDPQHVERLVFTRQVIQETMRLYPPAHTLTRVCMRETKVAEIKISAGSKILIPLYALHRHRMWWRDPDLFDPDRFGPDEPQPDRHIYLPFGAGPRTCLGAAFAMTELVVTLATLFRSANFSLVSGHCVWPAAELALRPDKGLPMMIRVS